MVSARPGRRIGSDPILRPSEGDVEAARRRAREVLLLDGSVAAPEVVGRGGGEDAEAAQDLDDDGAIPAVRAVVDLHREPRLARGDRDDVDALGARLRD